MVNKKNQIINLLVKNKDDIIKNWLNDKRVTNLFKEKGISVEKFKKHFAYKFLSNFLEIIKGKEQTCPYLNKFIELVGDKLVLHEIMTICKALKDSILNTINFEYKWLLDIFDVISRQIVKAFYLKEVDKEIHLKNILDIQDNIIFELKGNKLVFANKIFYKLNQNYTHPLEIIDEVECFEDVFNKKNFDEWLNLILTKNFSRCEVKIQDLDYELKIHPMDKNSYLFVLNDISFIKEKIKKDMENADYLKKSDELLSLLYLDPVTDLANNRKFDEEIEKFLKNKSFAFIMIRFNNLKLINEIYGREVGDFVLREFAKKLKNYENIFAARIDGENIGVLVENNDLEYLRKLSEDIIKDSTLISYEDTLIELKLKIAIVVYRENDTKSKILNRAYVLLEKMKGNIIDDEEVVKHEHLKVEVMKKFFSFLREKKDKNQTVQVINFYKEIPIKSEAKIVSIGKNEVAFMVKKTTLHSIHINNILYIEIPKAPNIKAKITDIDIERSVIKISEFDIDLSKKDYVSVRIEPPMDVLLKWDKTQIPALLEIASINRFVIKSSYCYELKLGMEINVLTVINIGKKEEQINLKGKITDVQKLLDGFLIEMEFLDKEESERLLSKLVADRQIHIIQNLKRSILDINEKN